MLNKRLPTKPPPPRITRGVFTGYLISWLIFSSTSSTTLTVDINSGVFLIKPRA